MYKYRNTNQDDFNIIATFPQNKVELFYMFPRGLFPVKPEQLYEVSMTRLLPTVIEYCDEIVGYSNLYDLVTGDHCWLGNVIINPRYRGKGAGKYLVNLMIERARKELEVQELRLVCHNTNTGALLLYNKIGFKPFEIKIMNDYGGNEIAGIKMKKEIL
ncbi:GNAT family N-acetyltransferase [Paenibacillus sp. sptzw28]|uniref:GNAT family N-acetyltransferase n=1 Tax=Paenibacillus sp. sptzw28 TaxID=715179 RepID=UPI001C6F3E98|nr:GNAT family N-acetyltransferase [Paenibacillus sp. sptzw28]QYR19636.1 GNAT family N-acetyltransferase [Paenibacillus sp. sptzw28]